MLNFSEKTQLCKCPAIAIRNHVISILSTNNIHFEKKIKREKFILKDINIKEDQFGISYIIYVLKKDYENAKNLLKKNNIIME